MPRAPPRMRHCCHRPTVCPLLQRDRKGQATSEADRPGRSLNPFPLQADGDQRAMVEILLNTAAGITHATSEEVTRYF